MGRTLLTAVNNVRRNVGLDPTITSFSNTDESNDNVQDINEAYEELLIALPPESSFLQTSGTITTANGTRTYSLPSDDLPFDLYTWSMIDTTNNNATLRFATREYIEQLDPGYLTVASAKPQLIYPETGSTVGLYPIPDGTYTIKFLYKVTPTTRLSGTTDTFIIPDRWVRFVEKRAQEKYERRKAYADPDQTAMDALDLFAQAMVEAWEDSPSYVMDEGY